jgi:hypothetical protein
MGFRALKPSGSEVTEETKLVFHNCCEADDIFSAIRLFTLADEAAIFDDFFLTRRNNHDLRQMNFGAFDVHDCGDNVFSGLTDAD